MSFHLGLRANLCHEQGDDILPAAHRATAGDMGHHPAGLWLSGAGNRQSLWLRRANEELSARFVLSFQELFQKGEIKAVLDLAEEILEPDGGFLFDGYRLDAPSDWRKV